MGTKKKVNWFMVMLLVPAVAMLTVTIIIPVFVVIGMSFYHYNLLDMNNITWNNFANYRAVFKDAEFIRTFGRTLIYVCGTVVSQFFIGLGVVISAVWKQMPLMMIMLLSGLQTVPEDLKEAAEIDGATGLQKFLCITVPCIMPVVKTVTLTSIVSNYQMFVLFYTMPGGGPVRATTTLPLYTYETAFSGFNLGKGAAIGVCWLVFLMIFSTIYNKVLSAKEVEY